MNRNALCGPRLNRSRYVKKWIIAVTNCFLKAPRNRCLTDVWSHHPAVLVIPFCILHTNTTLLTLITHFIHLRRVSAFIRPSSSRNLKHTSKTYTDVQACRYTRAFKVHKIIIIPSKEWYYKYEQWKLKKAVTVFGINRFLLLPQKVQQRCFDAILHGNASLLWVDKFYEFQFDNWDPNLIWEITVKTVIF